MGIPPKTKLVKLKGALRYGRGIVMDLVLCDSSAINNMDISIVVPCLNERQHIATCVDSLSGQVTHLNTEVIVVDGGSTDGTLEELSRLKRRHANLKVVHNPKRITPVAMNLGVESASGKYVMMAIAHASFSSTYLSRLYDEIRARQADAVGGVMETRPRRQGAKAEAFAYCLSHKFGVGNAHFRIGTDEPILVDTVPFGLYLRDTLLKVGKYDPRLRRNQDIEMSKRLKAMGASIYLIPDAICYYYARSEWVAYVKSAFGNGLWNVLTVKLTGNRKSLSLRHFVPLIFLLSLIVPTTLMLVSKWIGLVSLASFFSYLVVLSWASFSWDPRVFFWRVVGFASLHLAYGYGSLYGLFRRPPKAP